MYIIYNNHEYYNDFSIGVGHLSGYVDDIRVEYDGYATAALPTYSSGAWLTMSDYAGDEHRTAECAITYGQNASTSSRSADITVTWDSQSITITVTQTAAPAYIPIWKDTYYTTPEKEFEYYIKGGGEVLFHGRAYRMPGETVTKVNINKICQNYLSNDIEELLTGTAQSVVNRESFKEFVIYDGKGNQKGTYYFLYDWSYENTEWDGEHNYTLSRPVNGHYATNMLKLATNYNGYQHYVHSSNSGGGYRVCANGDYAIYYLNSFGGWDSFLIEGNCVKNDNITQHNYNRSFNNTTIEYEQGRYISEINTSYKFWTGWLTDEQAANFANNLLGSNHIYLHDLKDNKIMPAVITNSSNDYKTFTNQGNRLVNYEIDIKLSQSKIRK